MPTTSRLHVRPCLVSDREVRRGPAVRASHSMSGIICLLLSAAIFLADSRASRVLHSGETTRRLEGRGKTGLAKSFFNAPLLFERKTGINKISLVLFLFCLLPFFTSLFLLIFFFFNSSCLSAEFNDGLIAHLL